MRSAIPNSRMRVATGGSGIVSRRPGRVFNAPAAAADIGHRLFRIATLVVA
jgi:hypothetical protein